MVGLIDSNHYEAAGSVVGGTKPKHVSAIDAPSRWLEIQVDHSMMWVEVMCYTHTDISAELRPFRWLHSLSGSLDCHWAHRNIHLLDLGVYEWGAWIVVSVLSVLNHPPCCDLSLKLLMQLDRSSLVFKWDKSQPRAVVSGPVMDLLPCCKWKIRKSVRFPTGDAEGISHCL